MTAGEHGTYGMYQRERKDPSLEPCDLCRQAATQYHRDRRATNAKARGYDRRYNRARQRALTLLARAHQADYLRLLNRELREADRR